MPANITENLNLIPGHRERQTRSSPSISKEDQPGTSRPIRRLASRQRRRQNLPLCRTHLLQRRPKSCHELVRDHYEPQSAMRPTRSIESSHIPSATSRTVLIGYSEARLLTSSTCKQGFGYRSSSLTSGLEVKGNPVGQNAPQLLIAALRNIDIETEVCPNSFSAHCHNACRPHFVSTQPSKRPELSHTPMSKTRGRMGFERHCIQVLRVCNDRQAVFSQIRRNVIAVSISRALAVATMTGYGGPLTRESLHSTGKGSCVSTGSPRSRSPSGDRAPVRLRDA